MVSRIVVGALALALMAPAGALGEIAPGAEARANEHFGLGSEHYAAGRYREALAEFETARQLLPHRATLFNMARCHENLGNAREALDLYGQALEMTTAAAERADIEGRIARIREHPVRIFVASEPPGATVLVDAHETAEPAVTPTTVELTPGPHQLLLRRDGYQLTARRVVVEVGQEQPVTVALDPLPAGEAPTAGPPPAPCPDCRLNRREGLRIEISIAAGLAFLPIGQWEDAGSSGGVSLRTHLSFGRVMIGGLLHISGAKRDVDVSVAGLDRDSLFITILVEAGYLFPLRNVAVARVTAGVGGVIESYQTSTEDFRLNSSAHGLVGAGVDIHALRWLSIGLDVHIGAGASVNAEGNADPGKFDLVVLVGGYLNFNLGDRRR